MIDYKLLDDSINYYEAFGFKRIETPWLVTEEVDSITRPADVQPFVVEAKKKNLIASGEQAFLYLYLKEYLPLGQFQTITPCFRNDSFDFTHSKYFMKNELIETENVTEERLHEMVEIAIGFYSQFFPKDLWVDKTENGLDIMLNDYELGSYGIRTTKFLKKYIYGTACAEPRTSRLITIHGQRKIIRPKLS